MSSIQVTRPAHATHAPGGSGRRGRLRRGRMWPYLVPAGAFLAALSILPLVQLVRLSLSDVKVANINGDWPFVGLANFAAGFADGTLTASLSRTLLFVAIVTVLGLGGGVAAAIALRGAGWWASAVLALMVFIWALPPVINGSVWKFLLAEDGLFNIVSRALGAGTVPFLYDERLALTSIAVVNAWAIIPFNALVFRAAILNIDFEIFEAAQLDGARPSQELRYVLLPFLRPTAVVLAVLTIVYAFRSFDFIYVMTRGGPGTSTQTLPYLSFQQAFVGYNFAAGAATAVLAVLLVLVLAAVYARTVFKEES